MKTIYRIAFMVMAVLITLPAKAGWNTAGAPTNSIEPQKTFHSTSPMQGSGSRYVSQPAGLNSEGRATYFDDEDSAVMMKNRRRALGLPDLPTPTDDGNLPIGDAVIPLLLLALGYGVVLYNKRKAKDLCLCD